jgi:poly-gamma-glutamate capsule biosynthesis protein CapA/YwtB (metallophosphatase superfamily)
MPKETTLTDEQIAEMRASLAAHDQAQAIAAQQEALAEIKPVLDMVQSDEFIALEAMLAAIDDLPSSKMGNLRVHYDAMRIGYMGMKAAGLSFAPVPAPPIPAIEQGMPT